VTLQLGFDLLQPERNAVRVCFRQKSHSTLPAKRAVGQAYNQVPTATKLPEHFRARTRNYSLAADLIIVTAAALEAAYAAAPAPAA
jgi:hypothetical protein